MWFVTLVSGALIGRIIGYFVGVLIACDWHILNSNLSGVHIVFISGPLR